MIHEHESDDSELTLPLALEQLSVENIDLVIVEGFKSAPISKIEIHRPALGKPLISAKDNFVIAIATDDPSQIDTSLPLLDLNDAHQIASFIEQNLSDF